MLSGIKIITGQDRTTIIQKTVAPDHSSDTPPSKNLLAAWATNPRQDYAVTCFFGFFRSICTDRSNFFDPAEDLSVDNVKVDDIHNPCIVRIWLSKSKTNQTREGAMINLPWTGDNLCPVAAVLMWLVHRGSSPRPLFQFRSGAHLTCPTLVGEQLPKAYMTHR